MHIQKSIYNSPVDLPQPGSLKPALPDSIYSHGNTPWSMDQTPAHNWHPPMLPPDQLVKFSQISGMVTTQVSPFPPMAIQPQPVSVPIPMSQNTGLLSPEQLFNVPDDYTHSEIVTQEDLLTKFSKVNNLTQGSQYAPTESPRPPARPTGLIPVENIPIPSIRPHQDPDEIVDTGLKDVRGRKIELTREAAAGLNVILDIAKSRGIRVDVTSAHRSVDKQAQLWEQALRKYGSASKARKWVAPPGKSRHNYGKAIDMHMYRGKNKISQKEFDEIIEKAGMYRPMSWEGWHIEPVSTKGQAGRTQHKH